MRPFAVVPSAGQWLRATAARRPSRRRTVLVAGPDLESGGAEVPVLAERHPDAVLLDGPDATLAAVISRQLVIGQAALVQGRALLVQPGLSPRTLGLGLGDARLRLGRRGALLARLRHLAVLAHRGLAPLAQLALAASLRRLGAGAR